MQITGNARIELASIENIQNFICPAAFSQIKTENDDEKVHDFNAFVTECGQLDHVSSYDGSSVAKLLVSLMDDNLETISIILWNQMALDFKPEYVKTVIMIRNVFSQEFKSEVNLKTVKESKFYLNLKTKRAMI